jgi:hypothetical protein
MWLAIFLAISYARRSTIRKEWWFSSRMVLSWREVKALLTMSSMELRSSRLRMPERMPVIKRILNCCRWGLPLRARTSISSGAMRTLQWSRGAGRRQARVGGAKVRGDEIIDLEALTGIDVPSSGFFLHRTRIGKTSIILGD